MPAAPQTHKANDTSSQPCHCLQCFEQQGHLNILADKNTRQPHLIFANIHVHIGPCLNTGQPKWTDYLGFPSQQWMDYLLLLGLATPNIHMFNVHYTKNGKHNMIKSWWMTFLSIWVGQVCQMQRVIEQCLTNIISKKLWKDINNQKKHIYPTTRQTNSLNFQPIHH